MSGGPVGWFSGKKKAVAGVLLLAVIVLAIALNVTRGGHGGQVPVRTAMLELRDMEESVFVTGRVRLAEKQEVYADSPTRVKEVLVRAGDRVAAGQVLLVLDHDDLTARLEEARAGLELQQALYDKSLAARPLEIEKLKNQLVKDEARLAGAKLKYERMLALFREGAVPAQEKEAAELEYKNLEADVKLARESLYAMEKGEAAGAELRVLSAQLNQARVQYTLAEDKYNKAWIRALEDGVVISMEVAAGEAVNAGGRMITVGVPDRLEITAGISEGDSGRVMTGQEVEIVPAALPSSKCRGTVTSVSPGAVARTTSQGTSMEVLITVAVGEGEKDLKPGYTVDLKIITSPEKKALAAPYEAVMENDGRKEVFVVRDNKACRQEIRPGMASELYIEVLSGLEEGESVILDPGENIKDGSAVKEMKDSKVKKQEAVT